VTIEPSATEALAAATSRLDELDDPAIVVSRIDASWLAERASVIDARAASEVPLRGMTFAVKDNIDVSGASTTVGCPTIAYVADRSAAVIDRLIAVGALPVAKVNLDQFATGLVGTRSPFGTPRNPWRADLVPGGSSSGSGTAVARGVTTFAVGTDTAGSGRVPAAMLGIVGYKPTPGRISCAGVVPAVRSIDCVSVFAGDVALASRVARLAAGFDAADPYSRRPVIGTRRCVRRLGMLSAAALEDLEVAPAIVSGYLAARARAEACGFEVVEIDPAPLFSIGDLLYGGPWVAERLVTLDSFSAPPESLDPAVARIFDAARRHTVTDVFRAADSLCALRHRVAAMFDEIDALALPTIGWHVTVDEVAADPLGRNAMLGRFTTFTNLADLAAITFPLGPSLPGDLPPFSLTLHGPAWSDETLELAAHELIGNPCPEAELPGDVLLAVAGAHLRGQPLEHQLVGRGARFVSTTTTAASYRLFAIAGTVPAKPALVRVGSGGSAIEVDLWAVSAAALGDFLGAIPSPLGLGTVDLADGRRVTGFIAEPAALDGAIDITHHGGWRTFLASS
jgi:allophanate hydrolase